MGWIAKTIQEETNNFFEGYDCNNSITATKEYTNHIVGSVVKKGLTKSLDGGLVGLLLAMAPNTLGFVDSQIASTASYIGSVLSTTYCLYSLGGSLMILSAKAKIQEHARPIVQSHLLNRLKGN